MELRFFGVGGEDGEFLTHELEGIFVVTEFVDECCEIGRIFGVMFRGFEDGKRFIFDGDRGFEESF